MMDIIWLIIVLSLSAVVYGYNSHIDDLQEQAIAHECARYSPTTGEFEWLGAGDG